MSLKTVFRTPTVTTVAESDLEGVGAIRWVGNNAYRWVKYEGSSALEAGDLVTHKSSNGAGVLEEVGVPATADLGLLAGVVPGAVPAGDSTAQYFWVQVLGVGTLKVLPHTQVTGDYTLGQYLKGVNGAVHATQDAATQAAYLRTIQLLEQPTTHTTPAENVRSVAGLINCL